MFLQQHLRCKSLHYIQKLFSVSMADDELSGSDTEASSEDIKLIKLTLLNAAARAADRRAETTFHEMAASSSTSSSIATPAPAGVTMQPQNKAKPRMPKTSAPKSRGGWRRIDDDGDSTDVDQIAAPSDTPAPSVETADTPAPSVETDSTPAPSVETDSTPAPVVAAPSAGEFPCHLMLKLPIEWKDVRYIFDSKRKWRYDTKTSPMPMPHPNMEFRGYIENEDGSVAAFFTDRRRRGEPGMRMPKKRAGGVNKQYYDGLREQQTDEDRAKFKRENAHLYVPRLKRKGPKDREL